MEGGHVEPDQGQGHVVGDQELNHDGGAPEEGHVKFPYPAQESCRPFGFGVNLSCGDQGSDDDADQEARHRNDQGILQAFQNPAVALVFVEDPPELLNFDLSTAHTVLLVQFIDGRRDEKSGTLIDDHVADIAVDHILDRQ